MNIYFQYFFLYLVVIRPILSYIPIPPIQFYYYAQIEEIKCGRRKRNVALDTNLTWTEIFKIIFVIIFYPVKVNVENI